MDPCLPIAESHLGKTLLRDKLRIFEREKLCLRDDQQQSWNVVVELLTTRKLVAARYHRLEIPLFVQFWHDDGIDWQSKHHIWGTTWKWWLSNGLLTMLPNIGGNPEELEPLHQVNCSAEVVFQRYRSWNWFSELVKGVGGKSSRYAHWCFPLPTPIAMTQEEIHFQLKLSFFTELKFNSCRKTDELFAPHLMSLRNHPWCHISLVLPNQSS